MGGLKGSRDNIFYHREPGPVSIDVLRKFLADGWRLACWPEDGSRTFTFNFAGEDPRK